MSLLTSMGLFLFISQTPTDWTSCDKALRKAGATRQVAPILRALSRACAHATPKLAETAVEALKQTREKRSARLLEGARPLLPDACWVEKASNPAIEVASKCTSQEVSGSFLENVDAGTYLFILALQLEREKQGPSSEDFKAALRWFSLSASLQYEKDRAHYKP